MKHIQLVLFLKSKT